MPDAHHQQRTHDVTERFAVGAVEFGHGGEDEGQGHVFEEVEVRAGGEEEGVRGGVWGGG